MTFVCKVMSLFFNMLSRLVIAFFFLRSKHLLISWLQSPSTVILETEEIKFLTVFIISPSICNEWWPWGDTPWPRSKEYPQQDGRRGKFKFGIKPYSWQRRSEGSNKLCVHQEPGTPQRLRQTNIWKPPMEVSVSSGLPQGQGLWVQHTWVWH